MSSYQPFIDDAPTLARLAGQCFVVLRPAGALPAAFRRVQAAVRKQLEGTPATFPAQPSVTLAGFGAGPTYIAIPAKTGEFP